MFSNNDSFIHSLGNESFDKLGFSSSEDLEFALQPLMEETHQIALDK